MKKSFITVVLIVLTLVLLFGHQNVQAAPEDNVSAEYIVKAAFLYKFINFVSWPKEAFESGSSDINLCILGWNPFGETIFVFDGKTVAGRTLRIRNINSFSEIKGCHILYVSPSMMPQAKKILKFIENKPILTVGDTEGFAKKGGIINLLKISNRIKFEINRSAAEKAGLHISSKLLNLAVKVYDGKKLSYRKIFKEPVD